MNRTVYLILIDCQPWAAMFWRGWRLMLVKGDGSKKLMHRSVSLRKARETIAREIGRPIEEVKVVKLTGIVSGSKRGVDEVSATPVSRNDDAIGSAETPVRKMMSTKNAKVTFCYT